MKAPLIFAHRYVEKLMLNLGVIDATAVSAEKHRRIGERWNQLTKGVVGRKPSGKQFIAKCEAAVAKAFSQVRHNKFKVHLNAKRSGESLDGQQAQQLHSLFQAEADGGYTMYLNFVKQRFYDELHTLLEEQLKRLARERVRFGASPHELMISTALERISRQPQTRTTAQ